jgi:Lrp/AsnC family transcriptional regulator, regulator for asnA, asnC and gidA
LDELDLKIVRRLQQDGRVKFLQLAKEMDISEGTVRNRVKLLESQKVILQYSAIVDPRRIGFDAVAFIGLNVEPLKFLKVVEALARLDEIAYLATATGEHMVLMEVWMHKQSDITRFINEKISVMDGVTKISPTIILERIPLKNEAVK